ncbi:DUF4367 domain-containing protein [Candidatus Saccharibacteria bacterium]|nr:DUF4367 domain-containing protein [Candidatus Saccharibacteria bacterium]
MGKSIVVINGKTYDAISGLPIEETVEVAVEPTIETPRTDVTTTEATEEEIERPNNVKVARKTVSKQERMAAAIQQEFAIGSEDASSETAASSQPEPVKAAPDWLQQFKEDHAKSSYVRSYTRQAEAAQSQTRVTTEQPGWITNYVEGGAPIEIEPIGLEKAAKESAPVELRHTAPVAHRTQQRSQTLNRNFVKKPAAQKTSFAQTVRTSAPVATHPLVRKFDKFHVPVKQKSKIQVDDIKEEVDEKIAAPQHVLTRTVAERLSENSQKESSRSLKDALVNEQMAATDQKASRREQKKLDRAARKQTSARRRFRASSIVTAALAVAIIGGFFTYTQMPNISVRVAANRAGVDAKNPHMPSGYSIDGPVAYSSGSVTINYRSNGGGEGYSFTQQRSDFDNYAVLDKVVGSSATYETLMTGDLTVYRFGDKAAWTNRGVLYTLNGNERLSDNQILEIAGSV